MHKVARIVLAASLSLSLLLGQGGLPNGGFEGNSPNYFSAGGSSATGLTSWATDEYRTGGHSLKLVKVAGDGTLYWRSQDLYRYWDVFVGENIGVEVGGWVKLTGVNTDPVNSGAEVKLKFNFYDAAGTELIPGGVSLPVDQSAATADWARVKSSDPISFPTRAEKITVEVVMGPDATGIVWADDFFILPATAGDWPGDLFGANVDTPEGWFYWWPDFSTGDSAWTAAGGAPVDMGQDASVSRTGDASLKMTKMGAGYELVVNSDIVPFDNDGSQLIFSTWMKTELVDGMADTVNSDNSYGIGFTVTWHDSTGGHDGWGEIGGTDHQFTIPGDTSDWTQYFAVFDPPTDAKQYSLRARYWHNVRGTTWWDDFSVSKAVVTVADDVPNPGFEGTEPNHLNSGGSSTTATASWATDSSRTGGHSLKLEKSATDGDVYWQSNDLYRYWDVFVGQDIGMEVGAWVNLKGVNASGATAGDSIQILFNFYNAAGTNLAGGPVVLTVDQSSPDAGWTEVISTDALSFPVTVDSITVKIVMGANATGTVWVDDAFIRNTTAGEWPGDLFNGNFDVPDGWFYWWPDFSAGKAVWDTTGPPVFAGQDTSVSHTGDASLKMAKDGVGYEVVVNSDIHSFTNDGEPLLFSAWMKADLADGLADTVNTDGSYGIGFTVTWHDGTGGADGWGEVSGSDFQFTVAGDTTGWTKYYAVLIPPSNATQYSLRARFWHNVRGTSWWDDFEMQHTSPLGATVIVAIDEDAGVVPHAFRLYPAYPNPFNPSTNIRFQIPSSGRVEIYVYDIIGREVAQLIDSKTSPGFYEILWNGRTNAGRQVASGVYLVRARFEGSAAQIQKITFLK